MKLPQSKLVKTAFIYVAVGFLPVAANFLLAPVYTKFLQPDEYALVGLATLFQTFLTFFMSLSLDGAFSRIYFDYEKKEQLKHAVLGTLLIVVIIVSVIVLLLLLVFGNSLFSFIFTNNIFRFTNYGWWIVITTFCNIIFTFFALLYRNEEKLKKFTAINLIFFFIPVAGTLAGLIIFNEGALGAVVGRAIASLAVIVMLLLLYFKKHPPVIKTTYFKKALSFSLPLIPYQLLFAGFSNLDRFMLEHNFTLHDFGVYNFAVMVTGIVPVFLNALGNATNPRIFRELANNGDFAVVKKYNYINIFLATLVICLCTAGVVPAMRLFINKSYADSYTYFGTLFLSFIPYLHYLIYNVPLFYFGKTKVFPVIAVCALLAGFAFNKIFIPVWGIGAVCISLYIIRTVQTAAAYFYINRYKFNQLSYIKHRKAIIGSILIILVYNTLLLLHVYNQIFTIEMVNLAPLICFCTFGLFAYRTEINSVLKKR